MEKKVCLRPQRMTKVRLLLINLLRFLLLSTFSTKELFSEREGNHTQDLKLRVEPKTPCYDKLGSNFPLGVVEYSSSLQMLW